MKRELRLHTILLVVLLIEVAVMNWQILNIRRTIDVMIEDIAATQESLR